LKTGAQAGPIISVDAYPSTSGVQRVADGFLPVALCYYCALKC